MKVLGEKHSHHGGDVHGHGEEGADFVADDSDLEFEAELHKAKQNESSLAAAPSFMKSILPHVVDDDERDADFDMK
jgi:hypothetical protein